MKMKKWIPAAIILGFLVIAALIQTFKTKDKEIDQIYTVSHMQNGNSLVTWHEDGKITIAMADRNGKILKSVTSRQNGKDVVYQIQAAAAAEDGRVYVLKNRLDNRSGKLKGQDMLVYDFTEIMPSIVSIDVANLESQDASKNHPDSWHYGWLNISGNVISVIGVNDAQNTAARRVFEFGELSDRSINIKSERYYPLAEGESVYQAVGNGTDIAYISKSGKVFHATESSVEEIYPARDVEVLMYPLYISFAESGFVYIQDGESGNILKLNIQDGTEEIVKKGTESFAGGITPDDICMISMHSLNDFSAIIDAGDGSYRLCSVNDGTSSECVRLRMSAGQQVLTALIYFLLGLAAVLILTAVILGIYRGITQGRTVMGKLLTAALPLMVLTMTVFGVVVYQYYKNSVVESYEKQVMDEGNMMTALFGQESFDALEYPYDYVSEDYRYLKEQMGRRNLYSRVIYFEDGQLYTGVDEQDPCFYPIGIKVNTDLENLYLRAALTGEAQSASVTDQIGERIVSVTPVGGTAGRSVYLYETGIFKAEMDAYQNSYIRNFIWISVVFMIVLAVLLTAAYMKILQPLFEIRQGMELFAGGDRDIRIEPETKDELAGISRVFNKMADDIDMQILNLKNLSDIYYKFMPMSMIRMLKQENLGNLAPGSCIKGNYTVLSVQLRSSVENDQLQERARERNRFFNLINTEAKKQNAMPIVDNTNLSSILLICPNGVESAVGTALSILAGVDVYNAQAQEDSFVNISIILHSTEVSVVICGDEQQYIPATITPGLDAILAEKDNLLELETRIFVTQEAMQDISNPESLGIRYIGKLGMQYYRNGFYECFDDRDAQNIHLIKTTESNFRKAVKLYEEGYLYEAKNLFAMVLQDNPNDRIARYYIFHCE